MALSELRLERTIAGPAFRRRLWLGGGAILCAGLILASLAYGPVRLSFAEIIAAAVGAASETEPASTILADIRAPRVLLALIVGISLALSGAALQGVLRNPLADPGLIGVTSGAAVGAVGVIVLGDGLLTGAPEIIRAYATPLAAFVGAAIATALVYVAARGPDGVSIGALILAGVAITSLAAAFIGVMAYLSDDRQLRDLTFWSLGSLGGAQWEIVTPALLLAVPAWLILLGSAPALDLFQIGERAAFHSGLDVERRKLLVGLAAALAVGSATAVAGPIGFIGLVAPHIARLTVGPRHRLILPGAAIAGTALALASDLAVRTIVPPAEPPIGLATALIGGPFFLWLVATYARRGHA